MKQNKIITGNVVRYNFGRQVIGYQKDYRLEILAGVLFAIAVLGLFLHR